MLALYAVLGGKTAPEAKYAATADAWYDGWGETREKPPPLVMSAPVFVEQMTSVDAPAHYNR